MINLHEFEKYLIITRNVTDCCKLLGLCPILHFLLPSGNIRKAELSCLCTNFEMGKRGLRKLKGVIQTTQHL